MKLLALLFAFYFTSLSCIPCSDSDISCQTEANHSKDQDNHSSDKTCSPFCICACCHTTSNIDLKISPIKCPEKLIALTKGNNINQGHLQQVLTSIWQPPRQA